MVIFDDARGVGKQTLRDAPSGRGGRTARVVGGRDRSTTIPWCEGA